MIERETLRRATDFMRRAKLGAIEKGLKDADAVLIEATEDFVRLELNRGSNAVRVDIPIGTSTRLACLPFKWLKDRAADKEEGQTFNLERVSSATADDTADDRWSSDGFWATGIDPAKRAPITVPKPRTARITLDAGWAELAETVLKCSSKDDTRANLYGLGLASSSLDGLTLIAADGHRMCVRSVPGSSVTTSWRASAFKAGAFECVLPTWGGGTVAEPFAGDKILAGLPVTIDLHQEASKQDPKTGELKHQPVTMVMHAAGPDGIRFSLIRMVAEFPPPPWRSITPTTLLHRFQLEAADLEKAIGRVLKVDNVRSIVLRGTGPDAVSVSAEGFESTRKGGWEGGLAGSGEWSEVPVAIDPKYLKELLGIWTDAGFKSVTLAISDTTTPEGKKGPAPMVDISPVVMWPGIGEFQLGAFSLVMPMKP